ncbi:MAG: PP0621 family protein [Polaromonas sp.]
MKYLIVFVVVLVGIWFWRNNRRAELRDKKPAPPPPVSGPKQATEVVACAVCAVHLPRPDAVPGKLGLYCSEAHRRQGET